MTKKRSKSKFSKLPTGRKLEKYKPGEHIGRPVGRPVPLKPKPGEHIGRPVGRPVPLKPKTPKVGPGGTAPKPGRRVGPGAGSGRRVGPVWGRRPATGAGFRTASSGGKAPPRYRTMRRATRTARSRRRR